MAIPRTKVILGGSRGGSPTLDGLDEGRFWARVDRTAGLWECWPWTGARWSFGHGALSIRRKVVGAHRVAYELTNGEIPAGLNVLHHCDNPPCCNPSHLYAGTFKDNSDDMFARGRLLFAADGRFVSPRKTA